VRKSENQKSRSSENQNMGVDEILKPAIRHFRDLEVYRRAFAAAMRIYVLTKGFPPEERFSLVDQIRRASRSVCSCLAEGWRKRRYVAVFKNKITDSMQEASETQCWLEFSLACEYIDQATFSELDDEYEQIIAMLNSMEMNAEKFCY
jgi:four helix bundle protein